MGRPDKVVGLEFGSEITREEDKPCTMDATVAIFAVHRAEA